MEIINKLIPESIYIPTSLKQIINNKNYCFLDIETTGLSRSRNKIILIGILYLENNQIKIQQFFANDLTEEKILLTSFKKIISKFDTIFNYNGTTFDIPFINQRFKHYNIDYAINLEKSLDILRIVRKNKNVLNLPNYKLKSVESSIGLFREDKISGKESISLYYSYLKNNNSEIKETILRHNYEDIYYLSKILKIFDLINDKKNINIKYTFKEKLFDLNINTDNLIINNNIIIIIGNTSIDSSLPNQIYYGETYTLEWSPRYGTLQIKLEIHEGILSNNKKCSFLNKNDYSFELTSIDNTVYEVPNNIIIIKEAKNIIFDNIHPLLNEIVKKVVSVL